MNSQGTGFQIFSRHVHSLSLLVSRFCLTLNLSRGTQHFSFFAKIGMSQQMVQTSKYFWATIPNTLPRRHVYASSIQTCTKFCQQKIRFHKMKLTEHLKHKPLLIKQKVRVVLLSRDIFNFASNGFCLPLNRQTCMHTKHKS